MADGRYLCAAWRICNKSRFSFGRLQHPPVDEEATRDRANQMSCKPQLIKEFLSGRFYDFGDLEPTTRAEKSRKMRNERKAPQSQGRRAAARDDRRKIRLESSTDPLAWVSEKSFNFTPKVITATLNAARRVFVVIVTTQARYLSDNFRVRLQRQDQSSTYEFFFC